MKAVTCRTKGCENEGYTLLLKNPGHTIICGPCGNLIEDIQELGEPPAEEPVI